MKAPGWWPMLRRLLLAAFLVAVAVLLWRQAREVDWPAVRQAFAAMPWWVLATAAALAATSYAVYSSYDLLARRQVGHSLRTGSVLAVTFVSYAFNLNMGALVGGAGFRFRLYSQRGLRAGQISRVLAFSLLTNWSGYCVLLGIVLLGRLVPLPEGWELGAIATRWLGLGLLALPLAWLGLCAFSPRRSLSLRGRELSLPSLPMALLQVTLSMANWALIGAILWLLLGREAGYPMVLGVLLLAAIAGAIAHIPAGLGVLEAVFVLSLGDLLGKPAIIAALLAYRAIYYLAPLLLAAVVYLVLELRARRAGRAQAGRAAASATRSEARGPIVRA